MLRIIGGTYKHQKLCAPKTLTRPTSAKLRETFFNITQNTIEHANILDLFAGSGAIGIEAISRGALRAVFVENEKQAWLCLKKNLHAIGIEKQAAVYKTDALHFLRRCEELFDIVYIDPPYFFYEKHNDYLNTLLQEIVKKPLLQKKASIFIEAPTTFDLSLIKEHPSLCFLKSYKSGRSSLHSFIHQ